MAKNNQEKLDAIHWQIGDKTSWFWSYIAQTVLNYPVPWFGYDGASPKKGRNTVTLGAAIGWLDTGLTGIMSGVRANGAKLDGLIAAVQALGKQQGLDPAALEQLVDGAVSRAAEKHLSDIGTYELTKKED